MSRRIAPPWLPALVLIMALAGRAHTTPVIGADLSHLPRLLAAGARYQADSSVMEPLALFHGAGFGLVRLRLWHTPADRWHTLDSTIAFARRVQAAGMAWMLDLHYSHTWADPGHQTTPAAWAALSQQSLMDSVRAYTRDVLARCRNAGVPPTHIQLGNEIDAGLLWPAGRLGWPGGPHDTPEHWARATSLLAAAVRGVRDAAPERDWPRVLLHLAHGADVPRVRWFLDHVLAAGVEFDDVGVSYYPWWHGTLDGLEHGLRDIIRRYRKGVWVVETAYPWTLAWADTTHNFVGTPEQLLPGFPATPQGQLAFMRALHARITALPSGLGRGVVYWEPAFVAVPLGPANPYENLTLFDFSGRPLPALRFTRRD